MLAAFESLQVVCTAIYDVSYTHAIHGGGRGEDGHIQDRATYENFVSTHIVREAFRKSRARRRQERIVNSVGCLLSAEQDNCMQKSRPTSYFDVLFVHTCACEHLHVYIRSRVRLSRTPKDG